MDTERTSRREVLGGLTTSLVSALSVTGSDGETSGVFGGGPSPPAATTGERWTALVDAGVAQTAAPGQWPTAARDRRNTADASNVQLEGTDTIEWQQATSGEVVSEPVYAGGRLYVGDTDGTFYALDAGSGDVVWQNTLDDSIRCAASAGSDVVVVGTVGSTLHAFERQSGSQRWQTTTSGPVLQSPTLHDGEALLCSGHLESFSLIDGTKQWYNINPRDPAGPPAVDNEAIFLSTENGHVYAFDRSSHELEWSHYEDTKFISPPVARYDLVYVATGDGRLVCLANNFDKVIWERSFSEGVVPSLAVGNDSVYFATQSGDVRRVGATSGVNQWDTTVDGGGSAGLALAGDYLAVVTDDGGVSLLDADGGEVRSRSAPVASVTSPPSVADGSLLMGTEERVITLGSGGGGDGSEMTEAGTSPPEPTPTQTATSTPPPTQTERETPPPTADIGDSGPGLTDGVDETTVAAGAAGVGGLLVVARSLWKRRGSDDGGAFDGTSGTTAAATDTPSSGEATDDTGHLSDTSTTTTSESSSASGDDGTSTGTTDSAGGEKESGSNSEETGSAGEASSSKEAASGGQESDGPQGSEEAEEGAAISDSPLLESASLDSLRNRRREGVLERYDAVLEDGERAVQLVSTTTDATDEEQSQFVEGVRQWGNIAGGNENIANLVAWGESPQPWAVIEFPDGGTLANPSTDLSLEDRVYAVADACEAIRHAGHYSLNHPYLTPERFLFTDERGTCAVTEWGIGSLGEASRVTPYTAPEQIDKPEERLGTVTDVYRLGAVAYEAVCGVPPFDPDDGSLTEQIRAGKLTPPSDVDPALEAFDAPITRAMAVDPDDRYPSAYHFRMELLDAL